MFQGPIKNKNKLSGDPFFSNYVTELVTTGLN